jgi:hypothetical protein
MTTQRGRRQLPTEGDPRASRLSRSATRSKRPLPTTPTTMTKSKPTLRWPGTACASLERQAPTSAGRCAVVDTAGDHAAPGHPSRTAACLTATLRPHFGRTQRMLEGTEHRHRTPTPDTGHRRPEAGHWTRGRSDTRTGHVGQPPVGQTLDALTGHRRGQGDDSTAGVRTSWASSPSDRTLDAQPCSCSRTTRQLLGRSIGQAAPRRIALVCWIWMVREEGNGTTEG